MASGWSEIFSSHLSPFVIIGECGGTLNKKDGKYTTVCPCCGSTMRVLTHDLVCDNDSCPERTITGFEFMANVSFSGNMDKTSKAVVEILRAKKVPVSVPADDILEHYRKIKDIRDLFIPVQDTGKKVRYLHALANGWMRKHKLDPEVIHRVSRVWTAEDMDAYNSVAQPSSPIELSSEEFAIAIPYHASFSEVGAVLFLRENNPKPVLHKLSGYRYMWAGLQNLRPENGGCFVTQNFSKFFQCLAGGKYQHPDYPFTCLLYDGLCTRIKYVPDRPVYLFDPEKDISLTAVSSLWRDAPQLEIADSRKALSGISHRTWKDFVLEECARRIMSSSPQVPVTVLQFVDSCKLQHNLERRLCKFLTMSGYREQALCMDKHFSTRVIMDDDKMRINAGPEGYFSTHHKTGIRTDITNFIVVPKDNVAFREIRELTTRMEIEHEGASFVVSMPMSSMDIPGQFEEAIRGGWMSNKSKSNVVPMLKDRALFRKYVSKYIKDCASVLPCRNGVSFLGWSYKKDEFQGPGWVLRDAEVSNEDSVLHNDRQFLAHFSQCSIEAQPRDKDYSKNLLSPAVYEMSCLILGNLYRGRFDKRMWVHNLEVGSEDMDKILTSWQVTGQTSLIKLYDTKATSAEQGNRSYVFLSEPSKSRVVGGGIGMQIVDNNTLSDFGIRELETWWMFLITRGVALCLEKAEPWINSVRRLDDKFSLLHEGRVMLQTITGMCGSEFVSPYANLEELMDGIDYDDIGELIALDLDRGSLALNPEILTEDEQLRELYMLAGNVDVSEEAYRVGLASMSNALYSFYQTERIPYGRFSGGKFVKA